MLYMTETIMIILTGVIEASTSLYTIFSWKLWKTTQASVELSRYAGFANLMIQITKSVEESKKQGSPQAQMNEQIINIMWEVGYETFLEDINIKKIKQAKPQFERIAEILEANNINPDNIVWLRILLNKINND